MKWLAWPLWQGRWLALPVEVLWWTWAQVRATSQDSLLMDTMSELSVLKLRINSLREPGEKSIRQLGVRGLVNEASEVKIDLKVVQEQFCDPGYILHLLWSCCSYMTLIFVRRFDDQLEKAVTKMTQRQTSLPPLPPGPRHAVCHLQANMDPLAFTKVIL